MSREPKPLVCPSRIYLWSDPASIECDDLNCAAEWGVYGEVVRVP